MVRVTVTTTDVHVRLDPIRAWSVLQVGSQLTRLRSSGAITAKTPRDRWPAAVIPETTAGKP
jgi:hypothetical protein